jgi:hypothetical protein
MSTHQITEDLATAMMLIEMADDAFLAGSGPDLVAAAHAIIQNVRSSLLGQQPCQLEFINETLAYVWSRVHISDAAQSSKGN